VVNQGPVVSMVWLLATRQRWCHLANARRARKHESTHAPGNHIVRTLLFVVVAGDADACTAPEGLFGTWIQTSTSSLPATRLRTSQTIHGPNNVTNATKLQITAMPMWMQNFSIMGIGVATVMKNATGSGTPPQTHHRMTRKEPNNK
jgi:hypothetical protein